MKTWLRKGVSATFFVAVGMVISFGVFIAWIYLYPEDVDPKNIDYVLWAHGMNQNMNLDHAIAGMTHDRHPERVMIGLSKDQLKQRFGYIRAHDQVLQWGSCYPSGFLRTNPEGKEVVFLRDGPWMAILDHGRAVDIALCKGG